MFRHRVSQWLALLLVAVIGLTACGGAGGGPSAGATAAPAGDSATPAPAGGTPITITWGFWGSPEEKASHEKVAAEFVKTHPDINIEVWHQPWDDYFTKLKTLWASGDTRTIPDVLFLWPTPSYAATGVLEDLGPYIQKSGYDLNDY